MSSIRIPIPDEYIYQSARENKPVKLLAVARIDAFRGPLPAEDEA